MGCASCSENKKYRFKGFVVSVYPSHKKGSADEEALGKLKDYVRSNPERIPRICRKVNKILTQQLQSGKPEAVMVSVYMLRTLIAEAPLVDGFVPLTIEMCGKLFATENPTFHIGAADILCILGHRLMQDPDRSRAARRLLADNQAILLPRLVGMCSAKLDAANPKSSAYATAVQCRFAGTVALAHVCRCADGGAYANETKAMFTPMLVNLLMQLRGRSNKMSAAASDAPAAKDGAVAGGLSLVEMLRKANTAPTSAVMPTEKQEEALLIASAFGLGATAGCVPTALVDELLDNVAEYMTSQGAWALPGVPALVYRSLAVAFEATPHRNGFAVMRYLTQLGVESRAAAVRLAVVDALTACLDGCPCMSGARPNTILTYFLSMLQMPPVTKDGEGDASASASSAAAAPSMQDAHDAAVGLLTSLLRATYRERNQPQLHSLLKAMLHRLMAVSLGGAHRQVTLALRCVAVSAPYVRTIAFNDRAALAVYTVLTPHLRQESSDSQRALAIRALRGLLAGLPDDGSMKDDATDGGVVHMAEQPRPALAEAFAADCLVGTDERDVAQAEEYLKYVTRKATVITPRCVAEVANLITAIMGGYGVHSLPFVLNFLWTLQRRCVQVDTQEMEDVLVASATPSVRAGSTTGRAASSHSPTSPLTRAWLHMIVVCLISCGKVQGIPKLVDYGQDMLQRRLAANEGSPYFEKGILDEVRWTERYTVCGLRTVQATKKQTLAAEPTEAPVTRLPLFSYVANILVDAEREDIEEVFGSTSATDLKTAIEVLCFAPDGEANVSMASILTAAPMDTSQSAADAEDAEKPFSLVAPAEQMAAISDVQITLTDTLTPSKAVSGTAPAAPASQIPASLTGTTEEKIRMVLTALDVDQTTRLVDPEQPLPALQTLPVAAHAPSFPAVPASQEAATPADSSLSLLSGEEDGAQAGKGAAFSPLSAAAAGSAVRQRQGLVRQYVDLW